MKEVYVLGVGKNTPVFIDLAESCGYVVKGLYHYNEDKNGESDHGFKVIGCTEELLKSKTLKGRSFVLSMGNIKIRSQIYTQIKALGGKIPSLIHPTSVISRFATISDGVYISAFTHIQADTSIDENTVILSGVNISHTNTIGKNCFIAGGATIGAYTTIDDNVFIGQGVLTISSKVTVIGENAFVGARSLVTKSIEPNTVVFGSPAKRLNKK